MYLALIQRRLSYLYDRTLKNAYIIYGWSLIDTDDFSDVLVPLNPRIHGQCTYEDDFSTLPGQQNSKIPGNCTKEFNIVAVDYDPVEAYVYWTDQSFGINRVSLDGTNEEQLVVGKIQLLSLLTEFDRRPKAKLLNFFLLFEYC